MLRLNDEVLVDVYCKAVNISKVIDIEEEFLIILLDEIIKRNLENKLNIAISKSEVFD